MAAKKSTITITHGNEVYQTILDKLLFDPTVARREMVAIRNFFHALAGEDRSGSVTVQCDTGDAVYSTQTLTVSSGASGDTAVIAGKTLTCVDHRETTNVTFVADSGGSLNSKYFTFQDQSGANKYYMWFDINNAGIDPAPSGRIGIKISGATNATAATLATAAVAATAGTTSAKATFNADSSGNLNSTYFTFQDTKGLNRGYFWFNINSAGVDPKPAGYPQGIKVSGATNATAATLATAAFNAAAAVGALNGLYVVNPSSGVINIFGLDGNAAILKDGPSVATSTQFVFVAAVNNITVTAGAAGHIIVTNNLAGTATATLDGPATSTGFTFTRSVTGSAVTNAQYNVANTDTLTAANLAAAINSKTDLVWVATATSAAAVVTVTSFFPGIVGTLITTTATTGVSAGGATLSGGALPTTVSALNTYHSGV